MLEHTSPSFAANGHDVQASQVFAAETMQRRKLSRAYRLRAVDPADAKNSWRCNTCGAGDDDVPTYEAAVTAALQHHADTGRAAD